MKLLGTEAKTPTHTMSIPSIKLFYIGGTGSIDANEILGIETETHTIPIHFSKSVCESPSLLTGSGCSPCWISWQCCPAPEGGNVSGTLPWELMRFIFLLLFELNRFTSMELLCLAFRCRCRSHGHFDIFRGVGRSPSQLMDRVQTLPWMKNPTTH